MDYSFAKSLWAATAGPAPAESDFEPDARFDVALVGAGITGAVAALTLAHGGARVVVLEAERAGSGATGRSGGYIVPAFSAIRPTALIQSRGAAGEKLVQLAAVGAARLFDLLHEHRIECEAQQGGWFHPAPTESAWRRLNEDAPVWNAAGGEVELLDADEVRRRTGALGYHGAMYARSGGTVHPVKLVQALLSRAAEYGARVHTGTPVAALARHTDGWTVTTSKGSVRARIVVNCTNARTANFPGLLEHSVVPLLICQMATRPIPPAWRTHLMGQGSGLSDMRHNLFTYRFDRDWRLITGAMPMLPDHAGHGPARAMVERLARNLALPEVPTPEYTWFGYASVTEDRLPTVFEMDRDYWAVAACNGRGLAFSASAGRLLAEGLLRDSLAGSILPVRPARRVPSREIQMLGARIYGGMGNLLDALAR